MDIANLGAFLNQRFYSVKRLVFFLELRKTLFLGVFWIKAKDEKISIFLQKRWTNPCEGGELARTFFRLYRWNKHSSSTIVEFSRAKCKQGSTMGKKMW